jgi:L-asparaginase II
VVDLALGDVTSPFFPRSANKPMQAATMRGAGLDLDGERLREGAARTPLAMNCFGNHAAMLAPRALNGWPLPTYRRAPDHPPAGHTHRSGRRRRGRGRGRRH